MWTKTKRPKMSPVRAMRYLARALLSQPGPIFCWLAGCLSVCKGVLTMRVLLPASSAWVYTLNRFIFGLVVPDFGR